MKLEHIVKRIDLARTSKAKHILPYDNFAYRISSAAKLLDFIEEACAIKEIKQESRKYFVINCVSAMEVYYKRTAGNFIDFKWAKDDLMYILKQEKITIADLLEIENKGLSIGEMVSVYYSFLDLISINRFFSKMFGVSDFIKEVEEKDLVTKDGRHTTLKNDFPNYYQKIQDLISLRHLIVHHEGYKGVLGIKRLGDMWENIDAFVAASDIYILDKIPED
jgi:hypothetical protein